MPPIISRKPSSPPPPSSSSSCAAHDHHHDEKIMNKQTNNNNNNVLVDVRHLARERKLLRNLKDKEVFGLIHLHSDVNCSCSSYSSSAELPTLWKSCSRGIGSGSGCEHWSISAVPQPLPLLESSTLMMTRRAESTGLGAGHVHLLQSTPKYPSFALTLRKTVNHGALTCTKPSSSLYRLSSDPTTIAKAKNNLRVHIPAKSFLEGNSSCKIPQSVSHYDENDDDDSVSISGLSMRVCAKSAPSSVFSSPVTSPHHHGSNNNNFFDHHTINNFLQELINDNSNLNLQQAYNKNNVHHHTCPAPKNNHVADAHPLPLPPRVSSLLRTSPKGPIQSNKAISNKAHNGRNQIISAKDMIRSQQIP